MQRPSFVDPFAPVAANSPSRQRRLGAVLLTSTLLLGGLAAAPQTPPQTPPSPSPASPAAPLSLPRPQLLDGEAAFRNLSDTFELHLPSGWRTLAPSQARQIGQDPNAPAALCLAQPRLGYAVGPVDAWLRGDYTSPWLYVAEQDTEWHVGDDFAAVVEQSWRERSEATKERNELRAIARQPIGLQQVPAVVVQRLCTPAERPPFAALDVHLPSGREQLTLSFQCAPEQWARWHPEFQRWVASLNLKHAPRRQRTLSDRLWTPLLVGGGISVLLLVLYKHTRGRR